MKCENCGRPFKPYKLKLEPIGANDNILDYIHAPLSNGDRICKRCERVLSRRMFAIGIAGALS